MACAAGVGEEREMVRCAKCHAVVKERETSPLHKALSLIGMVFLKQ